MAVQPQKPVHSLIVDTGPLIRNTISISTMINQAEEIYTTPAILSEIRDAATRSRVETTLLPFLKVRNPAPKSYERVVDFSKRTGDYAVLSRQDMGILALAYEIECERSGGDWRLRKVPGERLQLKDPRRKSEPNEAPVKEGVVQTEQQSEILQGETFAEENPEILATTGDISTGEVAPPQSQPLHEPSSTEEGGTELAPGSPSEAKTSDLGQPVYSSPSLQEPPSTSQKLANDFSSLEVSSPTTEPEQASSDPDEDEDGDGDWITPTNLSRRQAKDDNIATKQSATKHMNVATMTTDYAMQNVLLQMNLILLSPTLQRIRNIKTFVMRCHACFLTTKDMTKQFCPRCGQPALQRVSCSTNANGEFKIHLARNYQWNNRGNKYSVPKPVAGTASGKHQGKGGGQGGWGRDLVLTEDQKEYTRAIDESKRIRTRDLMDEDYLPGILSGDRGRAGGRPKVGAGRNVNSKKRA